MTPERLAELEAMEVAATGERPGGALSFKEREEICDARDQLVDAIPEMLMEIKRLTARNTRLQRDSDWLACLEAAGVDNWEGISAAHAIAEGAEDEDDDAVD